jgi:hypothetical protein
VRFPDLLLLVLKIQQELEALQSEMLTQLDAIRDVRSELRKALGHPAQTWEDDYDPS